MIPLEKKSINTYVIYPRLVLYVSKNRGTKHANHLYVNQGRRIEIFRIMPYLCRSIMVYLWIRNCHARMDSAMKSSTINGEKIVLITKGEGVQHVLGFQRLQKYTHIYQCYVRVFFKLAKPPLHNFVRMALVV